MAKQKISYVAGQIVNNKQILEEYKSSIGAYCYRWKCLKCKNIHQCLAARVTKSKGCHSCNNIKHGLSYHPYYGMWSNRIERCYNTKSSEYPDYGGRGINMDTWRHDPEGFIHYVEANLGDRPSLRHTIDRINNDGNYEPGNLRWADDRVQASNRRERKDTLYTWYKGELISIKDLANRLCEPKVNLRARLVRAGLVVCKIA